MSDEPKKEAEVCPITPAEPAAPVAAPAPAAPEPTYISIDDFAKVEMRVGTILSAEPVPGSEKLLKLSVDFGEAAPRQVLSGIAKFVTVDQLVGKQCPFVTNLKPRPMMGLESQGMLLAGKTADGGVALLHPAAGAVPGTRLG
jgi:methionyl-tRNA synthetase